LLLLVAGFFAAVDLVLLPVDFFFATVVVSAPFLAGFFAVADVVDLLVVFFPDVVDFEVVAAFAVSVDPLAAGLALAPAAAGLAVAVVPLAVGFAVAVVPLAVGFAVAAAEGFFPLAPVPVLLAPGFFAAVVSARAADTGASFRLALDPLFRAAAVSTAAGAGVAAGPAFAASRPFALFVAEVSGRTAERAVSGAIAGSTAPPPRTWRIFDRCSS
jgi:hypothetical protein